MPRQRVEFASRPCKRCGDVYPYAEYLIVRKSCKSGYTTNVHCRSCQRAYDREYKRDVYMDPAKRDVLIKRQQRYRQERMPAHVAGPRGDTISAIAWVGYRCRTLLGDDVPGSIVVFLITSSGPKTSHPRDEHRPWRHKTWAIRDDRPGMMPPRFGVPIMRIVGTNAILHSLCPDDWRWVAKYTGNWLRRRHQEAQ